MICSNNNISKEECENVLTVIDELGIAPLKVKQRVLASTSKSSMLHTGSILTSGVDSFHVLFD